MDRVCVRLILEMVSTADICKDLNLKILNLLLCGD